MNWLARLKKTANTPDQEPTKPTKAPFVGFVAPVEGAFPENEAFPPADGGNGANSANWPEIGIDADQHAARVELFTRRGLRVKDAEQLAEQVSQRAVDLDDRRLCLECRHLSGKLCSRAAYAGAGRVVEAIVMVPQRCPAFRAEVSDELF
ncbi:hypothetical protein [Variovorax guangxiensis]|uniref:Uncharacterized protein n=1 Tax=Variovorax guangxiensis TaxID=1775474 RepID=A0A840G2J8_9BURK|nr:hypothetical protein [Variovorax guangxiensis]MBB4226020.1 hypothetical protein [Variovorax guangxiensis]